MKYLSVCSGIEAATVAWHPLGWEPVGFSEIEKFPSKVLAHHYPSVPNFGDLTQHGSWNIQPGSVDLLVGGTPCQSFSVAGKRGGLTDPRGQLMFAYLGIAERLRPRWVVWENVPGVLSSGGGRDFGSFLGAMGKLGYGIAYRVLDAQWCRVDGYPKAVPQRRRRVFVVGYLGDWRRAAAVLFESESVRRDSAESREAREAITHSTTPSIDGRWPSDVSSTLNAAFGQKQGLEDQHALGGAACFVPALSLCVGTTQRHLDPSQETFCVAFHPTQDPISSEDGSTHAMGVGSPSDMATVAIAHPTAVRRLTPGECESLQGFPRGYTDIQPNGKPTPDGPRYKAIGNSMAVNVMRWIGTRIAAHSA